MSVRHAEIWLFAIVAISFLFTSVGCSGPKGQAEGVINEYVLAEGVGSKKAQLDLLAEADRKILKEELDKRKKGGFNTETLADVAEEEIGDKFKVKVKDAKVDGEKMTATAEVTRPNEDELKKALMSKIFKVASEHKDSSDEEKTAAIGEAVREALSENDFSTDTTTEEFNLRKEEGSWKIFRNLKAQKEIEEEIDAARDLALKRKYEKARKKADAIKKKIDEKKLGDLEKDYEGLQVSILSGEARQAKYDKKYGKAIENYKKIAEIDPSGPFASVDKKKAEEKIAELKKKKERKEAQQAYREKISVNDARVKSFYGNKRVVGEIKNDGDTPLNKVELGIKFFDKDGNEVHQDTRTVVYASDKMAKAFKPGHSKKFRHYPHEAPDAWDGENVEVNVATVEFLEDK